MAEELRSLLFIDFQLALICLRVIYSLHFGQVFSHEKIASVLFLTRLQLSTCRKRISMIHLSIYEVT